MPKAMTPFAIALYQPDIAANVGAIARLGACFGLDVHIIEPAGFPWSHAALRRAGMDYLDHVALIRHDCWADFQRRMEGRRIVLASTAAAVELPDFTFRPHDVTLFGRESAGVPDDVGAQAAARVRIPMRRGMRSLNLAMSAAIISAEAMRQLGLF